MTSLSLFHCSSSVSLLPISQEAKPHCGLRQRRSSEIYFSASWMRAITKHFPTLTVRLCLTTRRIIVDCQIAYENGARVETSFVTSYSGGIVAQTSPDLTKAINRENDRLIKANTKELPKYDYPMNVITAAMMQRYARYGGRPENSGRWLHPGWKPGRTKAGRERYFWVWATFVRARSGSQMGTFGPRKSHHTAAWLVPCGGRRHQQNAPHRLRCPEGCHQRPEAGGVCGKEKLLCLFELEHGAKTCYNAVNQQCQGVQLRNSGRCKAATTSKRPQMTAHDCGKTAAWC